jgi:hypothetical protein
MSSFPQLGKVPTMAPLGEVPKQAGFVVKGSNAFITAAQNALKNLTDSEDMTSKLLVVGGLVVGIGAVFALSGGKVAPSLSMRALEHL